MARATEQENAPMRSSIVDRLQARESRRQEDVAEKHERAQSEAQMGESAAAFLEDFGRKRAELELRIRSHMDANPQAIGSAAQHLSQEVEILEQQVASAAYYLPGYDLRQATLAIANLRQLLAAATAAAEPRKKFSFSKKVVAPPNGGADTQPPGTNGTGMDEEQEPAAEPAGAAPDAVRTAGRTIANLRSETVVLRSDNVAEDEDVTLTDLEGCIIMLLCPLRALFLHRLRSCQIVAGPVAGATLAEGIRDFFSYITCVYVISHHLMA